MSTIAELDRIAITVKSHRLLQRLLNENPKLEEIMRKAMNETEALVGVRNWVLDEIRGRPAALAYYASEHPSSLDEVRVRIGPPNMRPARTHDAETLLCHPSTGELVVVTKVRRGGGQCAKVLDRQLSAQQQDL